MIRARVDADLVRWTRELQRALDAAGVPPALVSVVHRRAAIGDGADRLERFLALLPGSPVGNRTKSTPQQVKALVAATQALLRHVQRLPKEGATAAVCYALGWARRMPAPDGGPGAAGHGQHGQQGRGGPGGGGGWRRT